MTAFGRAQRGDFAIELHSVNKRHLEIKIKAPPFFRPYEGQLRNSVAAHVTRGQVSVLLRTVHPTVSLNHSLLKRCKTLADELEQELALPRQFCFELALRELQEELFEVSEVPIELEPLLEEAFQPFMAMKKTEGEAIALFITDCLTAIRKEFEGIKPLTGHSVERYRQKLLERLNLDDERVVKEVALLAEKLDVSEEINRFEHHLANFQKKIGAKEFISGKSLDFLLQELGREINTLVTKSNDAEMASKGVVIKGELEKIREQVQNIE
ncbi:MAG: YicC family protein [Verrucomicrobia bacterium]|nr:YicC family protein [Verrucomicrobiota bacterium]